MVFGIILKILGGPATLVCILFNIASRIPIIGKIPAVFITIVYKLNPFKKKDGFVSHPLKYKKQLNNDGGIGWVPYYGKPGRSCEENQDCPTFQKCNDNKCIIPPRVR